MPHLSTPGFHHVHLVCVSAGRSLSFYVDMLGLSLVKRTVDPDDPHRWLLYLGDERGTPGSLILLSEWSESPPGRPGVGGVHHNAFGTRDLGTLRMWKRRLADAGVRVHGPYDRRYFTSIYFADPDGQITEIATEGPGYTVDEPADALGRTLVLPEDREMRGRRDERAIEADIHPDPVPAVTAEMRLSGVHHVSAFTDEIGRAHEFYSTALGLRLVKKTINRDAPEMAHHFWASYDDGMVLPNSSWTLFGMPGSTRGVRHGAGQTHHVAFRAGDEETLRALRAQLRSAGAEPSPVLDRTYHKSVFFQAPDGQLLEICTDGPGMTVDEDEAALGQALQLPPHLEGERQEIEAALTPLA